MEFDDSASMRRICTERLGEIAGRQFAAMARPGFRLKATDSAQATGRCRLGGFALLEPGTPWPELGGVPLSLHAVLDTGALAPWLGDELPTRPGLLNFFYLDPDVPDEEYQGVNVYAPEACRVILADPVRAVETAAPGPVRSFSAVPVHAAEVIMLPDCWDVEDGDVDYDTDEHWGAPSFILQEMDDFDGNTARNHCAFGWPDNSFAASVNWRDADGPVIHLLQLTEDAELGWGWGDGGSMYFMIPAAAFAAGDFSKVEAHMRCC